jgi:hypothetical protein
VTFPKLLDAMKNEDDNFLTNLVVYLKAAGSTLAVQNNALAVLKYDYILDPSASRKRVSIFYFLYFFLFYYYYFLLLHSHIFTLTILQDTPVTPELTAELLTVGFNAQTIDGLPSDQVISYY